VLLYIATKIILKNHEGYVSIFRVAGKMQEVAYNRKWEENMGA
jgi:hypothetical protein